MWSLDGIGIRKFDYNDLGHMTKLAAMTIYGKNLKKNHLLWNQKVNDLENWYAALGTRVLSSLFK